MLWVARVWVLVWICQHMREILIRHRASATCKSAGRFLSGVLKVESVFKTGMCVPLLKLCAVSGRDDVGGGAGVGACVDLSTYA
ncbi:hypothetical protein CFELI_11790 [Corynebacterium felinum]|uniref:Secreted protein n=1 Tax=Corynebacterium felinum TaxID=131318 RepID=A0ABU2B566_9CORY|nr:hypothetical protein [Corynebacterium felinum]WJY95940.1 hypothetical protein CFELI_11790 [Corynebacterium felinum]